MPLENQTIKSGIQGVRHGTANFVTTDADGELDAGGLLRVESMQLTWIGTPATDEVISVDETLVGGMIEVDSTGKFTVKRTGASKTSALAFSYELRGY